MSESSVILDLRRSGVRKARNHPVLRDKPVMARGVFSAVFNRGRSVAKLTVDPLSYALLSSQRLSKNVHFPKVVNRYGIVGKQDSTHYLYLVELEKLRPVSSYPQLESTVEALLRSLEAMSHYDPDYYVDPRDEAYDLRQVAKTRRFPRSFSRALGELAAFVESYDANLDLHAENVMVRPSTGELVITDPVVDAGLYAA